MAITIAQATGIGAAGAMPSAPTRVRTFTMTFAAGDTYPTNGFDITDEFATAFPGETVVAGFCHISNAAGTIRLFEVIPGASTTLVFCVEESTGTMRQVPNATNLSAHSPVTLSVVTQ